MEVNTRNLKVPANLHSQLKIRAIEEGIQLNILTTRILSDYLEKVYKNSKNAPHAIQSVF